MTKFVGPQYLSLPYRAPGIGRPKYTEMPDNALPILAIDPGGRTGWSLLVLRRRTDFSEDELLDTNQEICLNQKLKWFHGEIDCIRDQVAGVHQLKRIIDDWPSAAIVMESFFLRKTRLGIDLSPVEIIAQIRNYLYYKGRPIHMQQPSQAKTTVTNDRLKLYGCYTEESEELGLAGHARDADRHALLFMRRCIGAQGKSMRSLAWPHIYGKV